MGIQGFQEYIEKHCPNAVVPVELQKLARGSLVGGGRQRPPQIRSGASVGEPENCLHPALRRLYTGLGERRSEVVQTTEDHHQEVIALFRENGFHGLVAYDSDYALCNIPYYFSAHALKLSRNGKSLTTSQYLMHEVAKQLNLNPNRFVIFASLLGRMASVPVVRPIPMGLPAAPQMLNIPGKPEVSTIPPIWSILNDSCLPIRLTHTFSKVQHGCSGSPLAEPVHEADPSGKGLLEQNSYSNIPNDGKQHTPLYERLSPINPAHDGNSNHTDPAFFPTSSTSSSSENEENTGSTANHVSDHKGWDKQRNQMDNIPEGDHGDQNKSDPSVTSPVNQGLEGRGHVGVNAHIPSLLSMPTRNHMDITTPPLPVVAPEVLRVAEHRHKKGLMYPYIYHVLTKGEIKLSVTIEDEANKDLPSAVQLYRPIRQYVYGVLFSLAEAKKKAERFAMRRNRLPDYPTVIIKEWAAYKGKSPHTPELVEALPFREWTCPNLKKLWLGKAVEDKNRRMRAFLACMRSDTPAMLNPANVPTPLMVLCCVLRFMLQWPGVRILRRNELDAFLAQALSPKLYEPDQLQDLKIDNLDPRGVQLAALFMSGVDMALFANDVCGQPIPWEHCCPWMYFDGKLLQSKLIRGSRDKAPLIDLCDGQTELVAKVEKMRQSILEGLNFSRPPQPLAFPPPPPHAMPFYPPNSNFYPPPPLPPMQGRGRGMPVGLQAIPSQGGKLEIAGTVVGQWAGSRRGRGRASFPIQVVSVGGPTRGRPRGVISTPVIRTFGRGTKYHTRGFKSQGTYQSNPAYTASTNEALKDRKKPKLETKTPHLPLEGSTAAENGLVEGKEPDQLNGNEGESRATNQPESAFSNEIKMCNTNPHLNALNEDGEGCRDEALGAAVLKTEE
ncbi:hypothetical protein cypCar_00023710 [Cyprinus carpio]|nr:hypothetical protein cypCar_00023710 [Cyprinus carpio]